MPFSEQLTNLLDENISDCPSNGVVRMVYLGDAILASFYLLSLVPASASCR